MRFMFVVGGVLAVACSASQPRDGVSGDGTDQAVSTDDDGDGSAAVGDVDQTDVDPPEPRSFRMGFSPFWASPTTTFGDWRYDWLPDADLIALHADDFFGVPWDSFATGPNPELPASWVAQWDAFADPAVSSGRPIVLSVSPLADRSRLAPKITSTGERLTAWDTTVTGVNDATHCWDFANAELTATAYVNYLLWLVDRYGPAWLLIATETDIQFYKCPEQKQLYIDFLTAVRDVVRALRPTQRFFFSFSLDYFHGQGLGASLSDCGETPLDTCIDSRIDEALALSNEGLALSHYPQGWAPTGAAVDVERLTRIRAKTSAPLFISETGWSVVPLRLSYATADCATDNYFLWPATATETAQREALRELLNAAEAARFDGVVWWAHRDYLDAATAAACPCTGDAATCAQIAAFGAAEFFYRAFGTMGLWRHDGSSRPALELWRSTLARPLAPR